MHPRRATWALAAAFFALLAPSPALAGDATIVARPRLRQGDPLLAWLVLDASAPPLVEASLVDARGRQVAHARAFPASGLVEPAEETAGGQAAGQAGAPELAPAAAASPSVRPERRLLGLVMALPLDLRPGSYRLLAASASLPIEVEARVFPRETIRLGEANSRLRKEPGRRKTEEAIRLFALLDRVDDSGVFADSSPFLFPVQEGRRTAGFGDIRRYRYSDGGFELGVHQGIDWAVPAGTPVSACARGRVALAADREVTGKTLVLEHLPGLYSLYFHLSSIEVEEGALVERGQRIGASGATGLATGPHLHWELRAGGGAVDPEFWLAAPLLDKKEIGAIMYGLIEGR